MKTTDLIPLILYQLVDGDKYGYEIVKQIEDSSQGGIVIKQPTLYSVLKKLEQGRFISSYWQDSDIGGKRHYYKLTDNGKAQLDTYPPFEQLISEAINEDVNIYTTAPSYSILSEESNNLEDEVAQNNEMDENELSVNEIEEVQPISFDFADKTDIKPIHIDLSTNNNVEYEFSSSYNDVQNEDKATASLFQSTYTTSDNDNNTQIYNNLNFDADSPIVESKKEETAKPMSFNIFDAIEAVGTNEEQQAPELADNMDVEEEVNAKFTEKVDPINEPYVDKTLYSKLTPNEDLNNLKNENTDDNYSPIEMMEQIPYLNYVDFSTDANSIKRKKAIRKHIQKMTFTCLSLLMVFIASLVLGNKYSFSKIYYIFAIITCLVLVLYPLVLITNLHKIRLKYCSKPFKYSAFRDFFVKLSMFLSIISVVFAYNLSNVNEVKEIFEIGNFSSFIAPIMLASVIVLDFIYGLIIYRKSA